MTMLTPYLWSEFHDFSIYLISRIQNAIWNFLMDQRGNLSKIVSAWVSIDWEGHVGPSPSQVGPEGRPTDATLVSTDLRLGGYGVQETTRRNPKLLRWYLHKTWPTNHVVVARWFTSTKLALPTRWNRPWTSIKKLRSCHFVYNTHTHTTL
jgi:hypothetical protein